MLQGILSTKLTTDIPLKELEKKEQIDERIREPVYVVCRYGNDSQAAVRLLKDKFGLENIHDIAGGLHRWSIDVDPDFPIY